MVEVAAGVSSLCLARLRGGGAGSDWVGKGSVSMASTERLTIRIFSMRLICGELLMVGLLFVALSYRLIQKENSGM